MCIVCLSEQAPNTINLGKEFIAQQEGKKSKFYLSDLTINELIFKIAIDSVETRSILLVTNIMIY